MLLLKLIINVAHFNTIPFCGSIPRYLASRPFDLVLNKVVSTLGLIIILVQILIFKMFCGNVTSTLLRIHLEMELLGHISLRPTAGETPRKAQFTVAWL